MVQYKGMGDLIKPQKDLTKLSKLDKEKEIQKRRYEQEELIEEMGQSDEKKALPTVQKYVKEVGQVEAQDREVDLEFLQKFTRNRPKYQRYLIMALQKFIVAEDLPRTYRFEISSSDEGIALQIENTDLASGFKVSGIPKYDIAACKTLAVRLGNTIGKMEGHFKETQDGIIVATNQDFEVYKQGMKAKKK
jgi:hypothetical protein